MKNLKHFLLENQLDAAAKFFQALKDYGYKRNEIAKITKNAPKWIYDNDVVFMDDNEIGNNDKIFNYLCDDDQVNFDNIITIADSSYGDGRVLLKYNDNAFGIEATDASLLLYKKGFKFNKTTLTKKPKNKKELQKLINKHIEQQGINANLNDIDTSAITDMSNLFYATMFNGDISEWDVSNVTNMYMMFYNSRFNGDISKWDVSNVTNMCAMFQSSVFEGDISKWDVSSVENMNSMFMYSKFNGDISNWDVSNVKKMEDMFFSSKFNGNISKWNVSNVENMKDMFWRSPLENRKPKWYIGY